MASLVDMLKQLTPQERNLWLHHYRNLMNLGTGQGGVYNQGGGYSTVLQTVVPQADPRRGDRWFNIPTVWGGQVLGEDQASARAAQMPGGMNYWPSYPSPQAADARYMDFMHPYMDVQPPYRPRGPR